jgi:hypothetical protein
LYLKERSRSRRKGAEGTEQKGRGRRKGAGAEVKEQKEGGRAFF